MNDLQFHRIIVALESIADSLTKLTHPLQAVSAAYVPPVLEPRFVEPPIPIHASTNAWGGNAT